MDKIKHRCVEEGDCLLWQGAMASGTCPVITIKQQTYPVRRLLWLRAGKALPEKGAIVASCGDDRCLLPAHMVQRKRGAPIGRKRTPLLRAKMAAIKQAQSSLTLADIEIIRTSAERAVDLAKRYGKAKKTIENIRNGHTWQVQTGFFAGLGAR